MKRVEVYLGKGFRDRPDTPKISIYLHDTIKSICPDKSRHFNLSYDYKPDYVSDPIEPDKAQKLANEINSAHGYCAKIVAVDSYPKKFGRSHTVLAEGDNIF